MKWAMIKNIIFIMFILVPVGSFAARTSGGGGTSSISTNTTGANSFIFNQDTLQSGATFYVSSGTVKGQFTVGSIPSTEFGSQDSDFVFLPSANFYDPGHYFKAKRYGSIQPMALNLLTLGSDEIQQLGLAIGEAGSSQVLRVWDTVDGLRSYQNYIMSGNGDGSGNTIINSSGTTNLDLGSFGDTLSVAGYSGFNRPILNVYSDDGALDGLGATSVFRVDHGGTTASVSMSATSFIASTFYFSSALNTYLNFTGSQVCLYVLGAQQECWPAAVTASYFLREDGTNLLREDGTQLQREQ